MLQVVFEKVDKTAIIPTKGSAEAACWDVYAAESCFVICGEVTKISTKLRVKVPKGHMLHIVPRSGLAAKHGVQTMAGIIDSDYRGELIVVLTRVLPKRYNIKCGDRIAQIQLHPVPQWECVECKVDNDTERGDGGFGSTDKE
jgi:dUTP pyrophosphatase